MFRKRLAVAVALLALLLHRGAAADPIKVMSTTQCTTEKGSKLTLSPKSVILTEQDWLRIDNKTKFLQDETTRLSAENESLKKSDGWAGWKTVLASGLIGASLGVYIATR